MTPRSAWLLVLAALSLGFNPLPKEGKANPTVPSEVEMRFVDGSTVRMQLLQDNVEVATKYGKLTIPANEIRRVEFGLHLPEDVAKQVEGAVKRLGSPAPRDRDAAIKELVALGYQAYPAVQAAVHSSDPEVSRRAEDAVKRIREKGPAHLLRLRANDRLETSEFPIVGRISSPTLRATSTYFGEKEIKIGDLISLRSLGRGGQSEFTVDAAKYGSAANRWLETDLEVDADTPLMIAASGQVDLQPDGNEQFVTGPGGLRTGGRNNMNMALPMQGVGRGLGGVANLGGALIGRIGESGPSFMIGESYTGRAARAGRLYLQIVASPFGTTPTGSYKVKVSLAGSN